MKNALLFLGFGLSAWGWLLNLYWVAGSLFLLILFAKLTPWRWQITLSQFYRWGDLASLLTVLLLLYAYLIQASEQPIFMVLKWLPLLFAPVLFAQLFSSTQTLPLGTLFYSFRKRQSTTEHRFDFQLPYTALTLLSAGATNVQNADYFVLAVALFVAVLWQIRQKHASKKLWFLLIIPAVALSYLGQQGLQRLQTLVEYQTIEWLGQWQSDPFKVQTSIGDVGQMKLSDKIIFRVKARQPLYLLQGSYDRYFGKNWMVSRYAFSDENPLKPLKNQLLQQLEILQTFNQREEMLALPDGTVRISGLEGSVLQYNLLGAVKISDTPAFADYRVFFNDKRSGEPSRYDLQIPKQHSDWLKQLSDSLKLAELKPEAASKRVSRYFQSHFRYSLYLGSEADADLALRGFMLKRKAGHCEYFAVATVLLLRQANIPARLATGYVVEEYDPAQELYVVRRRHAHAWAIAYFNDRWQMVDSTPSQWLELENEQAGVFQPVSDWFSNQLFHFKQWQTQQDDAQNQLWLCAAAVLALYLSWRIYSARQQLTRTSKIAASLPETAVYQGLDSAFYLIIAHFQHTAQAKSNNESTAEWIKRLQIPELELIKQWHYQLRFDPNQITAEKKEKLQQQVNHWLVHTKNNYPINKS